MSTLALSVANRLDALEPARQALVEWLAPARLSARTLNRIEVVLEEVLVNALRHGLPQGGEHAVALEARLDGDDIVLRFEDDGIAFDPSRPRAQPHPASLDQAQPGGRGLILIQRFCRSVDYRRDGATNRLTLRIARE